MTRHSRPSTRAAARACVAALAIAALVAACGGTNPTPAPTPKSSATVPAASASPTAAATPSIPPTPTPEPPSPSPTASSPVGPEKAAALQSALDALRARGTFPGISAAVVLADGSTWIGQSGVGSLAANAPLDADTLFSVGSISKTFTGALALRLAERGVISLNDRLSRWVPTFPNAARITLRQLLNHTSGLRDMFEPATYKFIDANHSATWTPQQVLARIGAPYFAPGKGYHYSSTNYILLGLALEKAGGKSLASMVRTEFLDPLGLTHTFLQGEEQISGLLAHGYLGPPSAPKDVSVGQAMLPYVSVATAAGAAGGFVSTPADIATWAAALYGGKLLNKASMAAMLDLSASRPYHPTYLYGLAVEQLPVAGHLAWGHRGHLDGFWSTMAYLPDTHLTVVVTMNADWPDPLRTIGAIVKVALA